MQQLGWISKVLIQVKEAHVKSFLLYDILVKVKL